MKFYPRRLSSKRKLKVCSGASAILRKQRLLFHRTTWKLYVYRLQTSRWLTCSRRQILPTMQEETLVTPVICVAVLFPHFGSCAPTRQNGISSKPQLLKRQTLIALSTVQTDFQRASTVVTGLGNGQTWCNTYSDNAVRLSDLSVQRMTHPVVH